jgi:PKHD-type hydroxylase
MALTLSNVLTEDQLSLIDGYAPKLDWLNGALSAGAVAAQVKRNTQADLSSPIGQKVSRLLANAVQTHDVLKAAAQPKIFSSPLLSKMGRGDAYGLHVDNAFMRTGTVEIRTDLSFTLFLSAPDAYEGGELAIERVGSTDYYKPAAGDLVLYPSTQLHEVLPVTSGERLACVGWIESKIRQENDREIMFDMENLKSKLKKTHDPQSIEMLTLHKIFSNLLRRLS